MNLGVLVKQAEKFTTDNAPLILTILGAAGTATTAVLTAKATFSAAKKIEDKQSMIRIKGTDEKFETIDKIKLVWPEYIPPVISCSLTVGAVIGANRLSTKRAAALAAAYAVSQNNLEEYKDKVTEKLGITKEQKLRDEIAQDAVNANPVGKQQVIITGGGEVLCFDKYTGRYFMSSMETLKKAENDVNFHILHNGRMHLNDFYRMIGLTSVPVGEEVGWNDEFNFEILFSTTLSDDNRPCIVLDYQVCGIRRRPSNGPACLQAVGQEE